MGNCREALGIFWVDSKVDRGKTAEKFAQGIEGLEIEWVQPCNGPPKNDNQRPAGGWVAVLCHVNDVVETNERTKEYGQTWQWVKKWLIEKSSRRVLLFSGDYLTEENHALKRAVKDLEQISKSQKRWLPVREPINSETSTKAWLTAHWHDVVKGNYHPTGASLSSPCILAAIAVSLWPSQSAKFSRLLEVLKQEVKTMQSDTAPCQSLQKLVKYLSQASVPDNEATFRSQQQTLLCKILIEEGCVVSSSPAPTSETHDS